MHPSERRLAEKNAIITDIQTPLGRYRRYADNTESIDLDVKPQKSWEFGTLREDRVVNAEKGRFTHYSREQFKDMHSLIAELSQPLQNSIDRTLNDMVDHHMQGIASAWQLRLSEELLPRILINLMLMQYKPYIKLERITFSLIFSTISEITEPII